MVSSTYPAPTARVAPRRQLLLSDRAQAGGSSAIRDLLSQANRPGMISLAGGLPDSSRFPAHELAEIATQVMLDDPQRTLQYGLTSGDEACREALTSRFGAEQNRDDIVVTTGSQQALDLIARTMIDPGDNVVVGDPDYLGALQVFRSYGADVRPVAVDAEGLDTVQLESELQRGLRPKCLYIVPNFHNPTGATMSCARRLHLNELSQRYGFVVIEDDPYRELFFDDDPPIDQAGDSGLTVRLRSTSKTLAPGLRVGALAGPSWLTDAVVTAKQSADLHTSSLTQAIVAKALRADWFDSHMVELRSLYRAKRDVLAAALHQHFGDAADFSLPGGGMFLWVRFHEIADTTAWLQSCLERDVCFVPGAAFSVSRDLSSYARLSFATASEAGLEQAVQRMSAVG